MSYIKKITLGFGIVLSAIFAGGLASQLISESTWFTSSVSYLFAKDNFHEVIPGKLYRSAALNQSELEANIKQFGIKTIIDLRKGGDEESSQGFSEKRTVESLGADYQWVPLVGSNTKQKESLSKLIELSEKAAGPVLIHCSSGTHRSGVATAMWLMLTNEETPVEAANQLSTEYGFFYWERKLKGFFMGHETIDGIIWRYLQQYKKTGVLFKDWFHSQGEEL